MLSPARRVSALAILLVACGSGEESTPRAAPASVTEPAEVAGGDPSALRTIELWISFSAGEGYGYTVYVERDGGFRRRETIGGPGGEDTVLDCTGALEEAERAALFEAVDAASLAPVERAYDLNVDERHPVTRHEGAYALVAERGEGARLAPADEAGARALVAPMRRALDATTRALDASERRTCVPGS